MVEDNIELQQRIKEILSPHYQIITATDGKTGFEAAKYHSPKLIISDILMPVVDGFEMCKMLTENPKTKNIPVILLSGVEEKSSIVHAYEIGVDAIVTKPFEKEILLSRVSNLLTKRGKVDLLSGNLAKESISDEDQQFANAMREIVIKNIENAELSVDDFASKMAMSRSKLYRKLKTLFGVSPNIFIRDARLEFASTLLLKRDLSVSEIAFMCGFTDVKYFTKCFNEKYSLPPSQFKKMYR